MAIQTAIKATYSGSTPTGFAEFQSGDTIGLPNTTVFQKGVQETKVAMAGTTIDLSQGSIFTVSITAAGTALTVSNAPAAGTSCAFVLDVTTTSPGTITWWSTIKWAGGTLPTLTTPGTDKFAFMTYDGGTTWHGLVVAKNIK